ncbi:hypothetical protein ACLKA6_000880 [Drosophila palustris]
MFLKSLYKLFNLERSLTIFKRIRNVGSPTSYKCNFVLYQPTTLVASIDFDLAQSMLEEQHHKGGSSLYRRSLLRVPEGYDVELRRFNQPFIVGTVPKLKRSRTSTTIKNQNSPRTRSATQDPVLRISPSSRSD